MVTHDYVQWPQRNSTKMTAFFQKAFADYFILHGMSLFCEQTQRGCLRAFPFLLKLGDVALENSALLIGCNSAKPRLYSTVRNNLILLTLRSRVKNVLYSPVRHEHQIGSHHYGGIVDCNAYIIDTSSEGESDTSIRGWKKKAL